MSSNCLRTCHGRVFVLNRPLARQQKRCTRDGVAVCSLRIDRRRYFESALARQDAEERRLQSLLQSTNNTVIEIRSLHQLDTVTNADNNALLILLLYSRSCGSCKKVKEYYNQLCSKFAEEKARVVFVKHDVHDDFDLLTDVARMYEIHSVPTFLFLSDGAVMKRVSYRDSRYAVTDVSEQLRSDSLHLSNTIRQLLFQLAPSATD